MQKIMDGNAAAAYVSYAFSELAVIYPITPSSPMAELADEWSANGKKNLFGQTPNVTQMQSEGGAAGALHGALTCGALATTYTCSQGLLLMLPNMYKIAGELLPTVFHVSARSLATHALSIFGDHQDVMACRATGFAMLASSTVQETMDFALIAHLATLKTSLPFLHFFDGFRTSHESAKIQTIAYEDMETLLDKDALKAFRNRALTPDNPVMRGSAQNPDIYFQNREAANLYYQNAPKIVQNVMDEVAKITKRAYRVFDYYGDTDAEYVVVMMGSGVGAMEETIDKMMESGEKVGLIKVRLYRPFDVEAFSYAIPKTCKKIAVLDRTKEAGALGEPLYLDVCGALIKKGLSRIRVIGGRYGLGSKSFTPSMAYAVIKNLQNESPKNNFTVGINDDITHASIDFSTPFHAEPKGQTACKFYGLGSDGTVGANKNSVKIIGEHTDLYAQAYFCYDSRKSGGITISHLRFSKNPIKSSYLINRADFVACHNPSYLKRLNMLDDLKENGTFLLNCPYSTVKELNAYLPPSFKKSLAEKRINFYVIDATKIADDTGLKGRTSTVMQAAFFKLFDKILPYEQAIKYLKDEIKRKFLKKGEETIAKNYAAIDQVITALHPVKVPQEWKNDEKETPPQCVKLQNYFNSFMQPILSLRGDELPVSAFPADGTLPTNTTKYEKHGAPYLLPEWIKENCIQCNQCSFVCPHACIRPFLFDETDDAPSVFDGKPAIGFANKQFRIQVSPHDCMGCGVCANVCPAKEKALVMRTANEISEKYGKAWDFSQTLPPPDLSQSPFKRNSVKGSQFYQPLFEFSYACAGCGETAYIKILTQLFGEKLLIANATGCSSIYGGSAPTCPYAKNVDGKGPAWANSLFEDNAEFGLGMRLAYDIRDDESGDTPPKKSVWCIGGDGWAYDIGYGGLDHVLASGKNVKILVLDSEVYSNTGGQVSKATPLGATARFAAKGKKTGKKPLAFMALAYGNVYVAQVSLGADKNQLLKAFTEAEAYDGPALIVAYSPCIAHGYNMENSVSEERLAVECGYWQLFRYSPERKRNGENPFTLDSKPPQLHLTEFFKRENRFSTLLKDGENANALLTEAEEIAKTRAAFYQKLTEFFKPEG